MFCPNCGTSLEDGSKFCSGCGTVLNRESAQDISAQTQPAQFPSQQRPAQFPSQPPPAQFTSQHRPPAHQQQPLQPPPHQQAPPQWQGSPATYPQQNQPQPWGAPPPPQKKKRHAGCLIFLVILLALAGGVYYLYSSIFLNPRDLGMRYTQADFDSALDKTGLKIDFLGKNTDELTDFVNQNKGEKLALADYDIKFSDYQEKSFELTLAEANAFVNEIAPNFTWFDKVQMKILPDGRTAGSYHVDFRKVKDEIIPDVAGMIPPEISKYLPDAFNLYLEGSMKIVENEVQVPEKLDVIDVGPVSLKPLLKDVDEPARGAVFDVAERIYKMIPDLNIHLLEFTDKGTIQFSGNIPTLVTVTKK